MKIIDFHAHAYQDEVWPRVYAAIKDRFDATTHYEGTVEGLRSAMKEAGINFSVVQPVANQAKHVGGVNDWIESIRDKYDNLLFFGAIHPGVDKPYETVCSLAEKGFRGVKMQPNAGRYYPNSKECFEIYRALEENNMVLLTHAGDEAKPFEPMYAHPKNFVEVFKSFPKLKIVLAHLGGYRTWDDLDLVLDYDNAFFDTAYSFEIGDELFTDLVEEIGLDRIIFGTDYPWYSPKKSVEHAKKLLGSKAEKVFYSNTAKLLDLSL